VTLIDTGPLIALVKSDDQHHVACTEALKTIDLPIGTVWPVLTEAMYLSAGVSRAQEGIWEMILRGTVQIVPMGSTMFPESAS